MAGPETPPATDLQENEAGLSWRRMHPVTPVVRGWAVIVALVFVVANNIGDNFGEAGEAVQDLGFGIVALVVAAILLVVFAYCAIAWRMMRYAVGPDAVHLHKGVLFRQQRQARLDRIQAIDVVQPVLARIFQLGELRIEVAGGADSTVAIGFLKMSDANELRAELLARAAGVELVEGEAAPVAPEESVLDVPFGMLIGSILRTWALPMFVLVLIGIGVVVVISGQWSALFSFIPAIFGFGSYLAGRFFGEANFTAAVSPDGIRLRSGLLETRAQTIPPGRVQALRLRQPLLWRRKDWWRVDVTIAGYFGGAEAAKTTSNLLLPVGDRRAALDAMWLVLPDLGVQDPLGLLEEAFTGSGASERFVTSPRAARWLDPWSWRRNGYAVTGRGLVIRTGRFTRSVVLVPHERTQSLALQQGPLQRRLGLTSFALHVSAGPVVPAVPHLADADAARLLLEQDDRARTARLGTGPEQWMRQIAVPALDAASPAAPDAAPPAAPDSDGGAPQ
ncbi:PH domain-containing protein [Flavimobilis soli]|uniref:PH domain-containing protein n=1 Tax=Flavimobilis soli TaxID=442709 RepID=UPI001FE8C176|nr:PH domain-containing protein [Flavimobilis soli]